MFSDAAHANENVLTSGSSDPSFAIPLLMQNKVPSGFETDENFDVSLRPDEVIWCVNFLFGPVTDVMSW